ncbi:hypothetical protein C351_01874 [Cryptococcus neoformans c8]|nr:hypothetical protein C353_02279 [Cryptococcus neoformans var. grubii AD1-83a]OXG63236.1 hypothetical protein C354_02215 [Cryptococcus neoformans var. grubii MW-RSA1955]OXG66174.1 hypothetical protein C351_01874 [Cryptococcus neoformans var. grubii c8]OXG68250.1 hypothetical protein C352_02220 [Cryptococcus neoformans var. grubii CHC193]OXG84081.1 hypothetical protein C350_02194 [Cryptococcus neoformans var. grubii MW-RSA36]OXH14066.1 hypothetical protein C369_02260 [Cryptococcus neoformans 
MPSLFTALSLSTLAGPRIIPQVPTLAELQKQSESLGSSISESLPSSLPAYSTSFQSSSSFPSLSGGGGNGNAKVKGTYTVLRPEKTAVLGRDPAGLLPRLNPSVFEGKSWYTRKFLSAGSGFIVNGQSAAPPSYTESDPHPHHDQLVPPNKLKKQFPRWLRLQQSIPEEDAKPRMVGSKVYAESVHSGQPSIHEMHKEDTKPGFWEWMTCRACT